MKKYIIVAILFFFSYTNLFAQFGLYASAAYINANGSNSFYNNTAPGLGQDIGTATFQGTNLGSFEQNSGTLKLTGAEIKTYKGASDNVCSGTLYFTVYLTGARPVSPVFTPVILGFFSDCFAPACTSFFGSFNIAAGGGCCSAGDQKWQSPGFGSAANIDLTTYSPGIYTLEMYYEYTGQDGGAGCGTTKYDNNSNNPTNYTAGFIIAVPIPVSFGNIAVSNNRSYNTVIWKTYTESLTKTFMLERSADGIHYVTIAETPAAGFSSSIRSYSLPDMSPLKGINYYRVKMIETDGKYQYSSIVKTTNKAEDSWYVLSNQGRETIQVGGIEKGNEVSIFDPLGTRIFNTRSNGSYCNISTSNIPAGVYFVKVTSNNSSSVKQIFISH